MTSAHIFYIPIVLFVGLLAGYFIGQRAAEQRRRERRKKLERRRALQKRDDRPADAPDESAGESARPDQPSADPEQPD